jgi:hypothetical protein
MMVISVKMEKWTKDKVFKWLQKDCNLSRKQAQIFLGQEIDGQALQCLTQEDLMKPPLLLKLGPTKRVLSHVQNASGQIILLFPRVCANTHAIMPSHICTPLHICTHFAIMPTSICTHKCGHAHAYMHTQSQSFQHTYT